MWIWKNLQLRLNAIATVKIAILRPHHMMQSAIWNHGCYSRLTTSWCCGGNNITWNLQSKASYSNLCLFSFLWVDWYAFWCAQTFTRIIFLNIFVKLYHLIVYRIFMYKINFKKWVFKRFFYLTLKIYNLFQIFWFIKLF